jgi:hypothetical protein
MLFAKAKIALCLTRIVNYVNFIVQASVIMIVNYIRNLFKVKATQSPLFSYYGNTR